MGSDAAQIRAWKKRLDGVVTKRTKLKTRLLKILETPNQPPEVRLENFNNERKKLLSDEHDQGFFWQPHFDWFWDNVTSFLSILGIHRVPSSGSKLFKQLQIEPDLELQLTDDLNFVPNASHALDSKTYRKALIDNPLAALADLKFRLNLLTAESGKKLTPVFKRLYELKPQLNAATYQTFLEILYQYQPIKTLTFFYSKYRKNQSETPDSLDFVEQYMMARALIDAFVSNHSDINAHQHNIHYLLILLSISRFDKKSFFATKPQIPSDLLLKLLNTSQDSQDSNAISNLPSIIYDNYAYHIKMAITEKLSEETRNVRQAQSRASIVADKHDIQLDVLLDIYKYFDPEQHPLLIHFCRQACELLVQDLRKNEEEKTWLTGHQGYRTIRFIAKELLGTWKDAEPGATSLYRPNDHLDMLDTVHHRIACIPGIYKFAEKCAMEIILESLQASESIYLTTASKIRSHYYQRLNPEITNWIMIRVRHFNPALLPSLQHILVDVVYYNEADLPAQSQPLDAEYSVEQYLPGIDNYLSDANLARESLDAEKENRATASAIALFVQLLEHPQLRSEYLQRAHATLTSKFRHLYITESLYLHWDAAITRKQKTLCSWDMILLNAHTAESNGEKEGEASIVNVARYCELAVIAKNDHDFVEEYQQSQRVLCTFSKLMQQPFENPSELDAAFSEILPQLKEHYIDQDLNIYWEQLILKQQAQFCTWDLAKLSGLSSLGSNSTDSYLDQAKSHYLSAQRYYNNELLREYKLSKSAVQAFARFMEEPCQTEISKAIRFLSKLKIYLTSEQYQNWFNHLKSLEPEPSNGSWISFFEKPNAQPSPAADTASPGNSQMDDQPLAQKAGL